MKKINPFLTNVFFFFCRLYDKRQVKDLSKTKCLVFPAVEFELRELKVTTVSLAFTQFLKRKILVLVETF